MTANNKRLWDLIYQAFEQTSQHGVEVVLAMGADKNEVQHRLLRGVATLRHAKADEQAGIIEQLRADVMLTAAQNWITPDRAEQIQQILDNYSSSTND